jgi:CheY-like chemotaxis protein
MKFLKRILIAEDAPDSRRVFELALCDTGEIDSARDGEAALEMYHDRAARGIAYDLILLDIAMPKINGFQVAEAIRASGDEATPIVFLTAYGEPETLDARRARRQRFGTSRLRSMN